MMGAKLCLWLGVLILLTLSVLGIDVQKLDPARDYCSHRGYEYVQADEQNGWCYFDDGSRCDAKEYYDGRCGDEYRHPFQCRTANQIVWDFEECCSGLEPYNGPDNAYRSCFEPSIGRRMISVIFFSRAGSILVWGIIALLFLLGIILILRGRLGS